MTDQKYTKAELIALLNSGLNDGEDVPAVLSQAADMLENSVETENIGSMWINAFSLVRPTDEFLTELGRDFRGMLKIPGQTYVRVSAT